MNTIKKRYNINQVMTGMELAGSLMLENGTYALNEGTVLTASLIDRLKQWGVENLYVWVEAKTVDDNSSLLLPPEYHALSELYEANIQTIRKVFETARASQELLLPEIKTLADNIVDQFIDVVGVLNNLLGMERVDDYLFYHSVNVSIVSGIIGRWLDYNDEDIRELVLAGLLHDIGKTQIANEIISKAGSLDLMEMDTVRLHTTKGYSLLKDLRLPPRVIYAVLQHHEREDGSGYPLKVLGEKIHPDAKIIAIADVYDAMTSDKVYREKTTPFHAADTIARDMYDKLDPKYCALFVNNLRDYFIGNIVELSDGREAEVVYLGRTTAARPIVRTNEGQFIDLEKDKRISIAKVVKA